MHDKDFFEIHEKRRTFKIENNIVIGQDVTQKNEKVNVGELILDKLKSSPNFVSQVDSAGDLQSTNREMRERSVKCALWLKKQGVQPGDVVSICTHNHINTYVPCLASLYIGAVMNPLDNNMNVATAQYFINLIEPKVMFTNAATASLIAEALKLVSKTDTTLLVVLEDIPGYTTLKDILAGQTDAEVEGFECTKLTDPLHPAIILHSSGTTGMPKAAILCHSRIIWPQLLADVGFTPNKIALWYSPLFWITSGIFMLHGILFDIKRIICTEFEEQKTCDLVEKYEINWIFCAATMLSRLVKSGVLMKHKLPSLKWMATGGAMMSKETLLECEHFLPHVVIQQCYGMTESGLISAQEKRSKAGSVGTVIRGAKFKVIDSESGKILGPNEKGEICAKTLSAMLGYYKNPEATKQTIDEEGWVHTGDLGYFNEEGDLFVVDRLKELIKYKGYHIAPAEIEKLLMTHPSVFEAAVISVRHPIDEEHPLAFVVKKRGQTVTKQELIDLVANNLEDYKKLRAGVMFIDKLPTTPTGKISRKDLKLLIKSVNEECVATS